MLKEPNAGDHSSDLLSVYSEMLPETSVVVLPIRLIASSRTRSESPKKMVHGLHTRGEERAAGREAAAQALGALGLAATNVPSGPLGEPVWPKDIVGSISHTKDFAVAAVARAGKYRSLGIDLERKIDFDGSVASLIMNSEEIARKPSQFSKRHWEGCHFCAKESVIKVLSPLFQRSFDFLEIDLQFDGTRYLAKSVKSGGIPSQITISGKVARSRDHVLSVAFLDSSNGL